jgi:hypothetical protein
MRPIQPSSCILGGRRRLHGREHSALAGCQKRGVSNTLLGALNAWSLAVWATGHLPVQAQEFQAF